MADGNATPTAEAARLEPLPKGANFIRAKMLWEIGLDVAGDIAVPYGGDRDMRISVGSGGGDAWKPSLSLATGSAVMAHDVCRGAVDMAFVNPSALLTQAHRGVGLFESRLPVRVVCSYPSWDSFAMVVHPRTGLASVRDVKARRYPLKISVREDPTHSTLVLIEQMLRLDGFGLEDVVAWGGELVTTGSPSSPRRMEALRTEAVDAVFDEALVVWLGHALASGYRFLDFSPGALDAMTALGWRRTTIGPGDYPGVARDYACLDFSGWPLYCRGSLDERTVIDVCEAVVARRGEIPWTAGDYRGVTQLFSDTRETPLDVPLHSGVEKFLRDNRGKL